MGIKNRAAATALFFCVHVPTKLMALYNLFDVVVMTDDH